MTRGTTHAVGSNPLPALARTEAEIDVTFAIDSSADAARAFASAIGAAKQASARDGDPVPRMRSALMLVPA